MGNKLDVCGLESACHYLIYSYIFKIYLEIILLYIKLVGL